MAEDKQPICAIVGAGPGNGASLGRRFARAGYRVALLARNTDMLGTIAKDIEGSHAIVCDVTDSDSIRNAHSQLVETLGPPSVLIYNAGSGVFGSVDEVTEADFEAAWRTNAAGLLSWAQAVLPAMREAGTGAILVIGATAAKRGGAGFTAFASAKHAQHGLTQSLARKLGPDGIHVAYVIIDGVIDLDKTRRMLPNKPDNFFLQPDAIADSVYRLTEQPPSAWTFELDLRPFGENW